MRVWVWSRLYMWVINIEINAQSSVMTRIFPTLDLAVRRTPRDVDGSGWIYLVYYESIKREPKIRGIYECRSWTHKKEKKIEKINRFVPLHEMDVWILEERDFFSWNFIEISWNFNYFIHEISTILKFHEISTITRPCLL